MNKIETGVRVRFWKVDLTPVSVKDIGPRLGQGQVTAAWMARPFFASCMRGWSSWMDSCYARLVQPSFQSSRILSPANVVAKTRSVARSSIALSSTGTMGKSNSREQTLIASIN